MSDIPDRRSQKSTRALWLGLLTLLQDHDWADITVQMIADRADVARSTFYGHYQTKQDLLNAGFSLATDEIRKAVLARKVQEGQLATVDWLIAHVSDSQGFMRRVQGTSAGLVILHRFRATFAVVLRDELARRGHLPRDLPFNFQVGGLFYVVEQWLQSKDGLDAKALGAALSAQILALQSNTAGKIVPAAPPKKNFLQKIFRPPYTSA